MHGRNNLQTNRQGRGAANPSWERQAIESAQFADDVTDLDHLLAANQEGAHQDYYNGFVAEQNPQTGMYLQDSTTEIDQAYLATDLEELYQLANEGLDSGSDPRQGSNNYSQPPLAASFDLGPASMSPEARVASH